MVQKVPQFTVHSLGRMAPRLALCCSSMPMRANSALTRSVLACLALSLVFTDISYLQSLPLSSEEEGPQAARAAISSLRHSLASVCGDERGSDLLEKCVAAGLTLPPSSSDADANMKFEEAKSDVLDATLEALDALSPYWEFLSINRYGSHVVEALLAALPPLFQHLPEEHRIFTSLLDMAEVFQASLLEYSTHVAGSHVLRSLLCVLGGCVPQQVLTARGSKGKHKHSGSGRSPVTSSCYPSSVNIYENGQAVLKPKFDAIIEELIKACRAEGKTFLQVRLDAGVFAAARRPTSSLQL